MADSDSLARKASPPTIPEESVDASEASGPVYEPLASGATPPSPDEAHFQTRRMHTAGTAATATTVPDSMAPGSNVYGDEDDAASPPRPSVFQRIGLDLPTAMMMFKGSLPPMLAIAAYQSTSFSDAFPTLGYIIPIISVMTVPILPRGKFLQLFVLNVFAISLGIALGLLVLYSGIQARAHTSGPLTQDELAEYKATRRPPYNSSQSAVCAVWLVFNIWMINTVRAKMPSFNLPAIVFSIAVNIACTTGPLFTNMTQAMALMRQLYTAMLTATALSAGVSLFVFPVSSRRILATQAGSSIRLLRKAVALQGEYLRGLERDDMYELVTVETAVGDLGPAPEKERQMDKLRRKFKKRKGLHGSRNAPPPLTREEKAARALRDTISSLRELSGKMQQELRFAKRDAAFGKLTAHDLGEIVRLVRNVVIPVTGMSTIMDIFRRTADKRGWNAASEPGSEEAIAKEKERCIWNEVMVHLHEPFAILSEAIDEGLEHAGLQLGLLPKTKEQKAKDKAARKLRKARKAAVRASQEGHDTKPDKEADGATGANEQEGRKDDTPSSDDVEASAGVIKPGDDRFVDILRKRVKQFHNTRSEILHLWARERGLMGDLPPLSPSKSGGYVNPDGTAVGGDYRQSQLYVILYMEQLMSATGEAVLDFVLFADKKVADGTMDKTRFLFPTTRRLVKWFISIFNDEPTNEGSEEVIKPNVNVVFTGDSFSRKKDPEHLPAANLWQKFGNGLRSVSELLGSAESLFGLRVACATMTVAIVCYLHDGQVFFQEQRLVWAMIIIAISMTQTSGQSIFGFFCRIAGSALAMVATLIVWYIVDEKTPGIIVFTWFFIFISYYFFIKYPRFVPASMIAIITQVLIIAYELQVRKVGVLVVTSTGQPYYPIYELAPYRLATVTAGCLVAFFWTIFPKPVTDRAWLRRDLSATLYILAVYFSVINETLKATLYMNGGNPNTEGTPAYRLTKIRQKLFSKLMLLLPSLQLHSDWQKWEPTIGGAFPRSTYEDIILRSSRILNYLTLISYTATWKPRHAPELIDDAWIKALADLIRSIGPTHYTILSTLALLSNSLLSGQSLPPYIPLPRPYELTRQLLTLKRGEGNGGANGGSGAAGENAVKASGNAVGGSGGGHDGAGDDSFVKQPPRRRTSLWRRPSFRPDKNNNHNHNNHNNQNGHSNSDENSTSDSSVFVRQTEEEAVSNDFMRPKWRDVSSTEINTVTGASLARLETSQAVQLGSLLDVRNIEKHGYTEFAVLQVCSTLICDDLEGMIQDVGRLVGVVDFSFRMDEKEADILTDSDKGKGKTE